MEGLIDTDIIVVDTIEPGQYRHYRRFKALVSRGGGLLSHGATLLREMAIPSAINPNAGQFKSGQQVRFDNGIIQAIEDDPSTQ